MKINSKVILIGLLLVFFGFIGGFSIGRLSIGIANYPQTSLPQVKIAIDNYPVNCVNLSLMETASCLQQNVSGFFYYNMSNVNNTRLTDKELEQEGGVCYHYARWYSQRAIALGFYAEEVSVQLNQSISHRFTVMSNNKGYCVLDENIAPKCQQVAL